MSKSKARRRPPLLHQGLFLDILADERARPLFIYTTADIMSQKPQVADFINFYLTYVDEEVTDVGYFPASPDAFSAAKQAWLCAVVE